MSFDSRGYELIFIQKDRGRNQTDPLFIYIFRFRSIKNKLKYIVRAEYYDEDYCALKFYIQQHSKSDKKYNLINQNGKSDIFNIIITAAKAIPFVLKDYPLCSFGFIASPTYEKRHNHLVLVEDINNNQRYKVYIGVIERILDGRKFTEFYNDRISGVLFVNNKNEGIEEKRTLIENDFSRRWIFYPLPS